MSFADLVVSLVARFPIEAGDAASGVLLEVTEVDLRLPIEVRITEGGELTATAPRGRLATGFDLPHAHIAARFNVRER